MSSALSTGDVVAGRYELDRPLGEGGMGTVWTAIQTVTQRSVALKVLRVPPDTPDEKRDELQARLRREARAACAVRHPNVVHIYDVIELEDGAPAIVMELLEGESLEAHLKQRSKLSLEQLAPIMVAVISAVRAAHAAGIVHRDLKPANIFLARGGEDAGDVIKVLDFGIAKVTGEYADGATVTSGLTGTGAMLGTPYYMAPEQVFGEDVDHRADIWSLGVIAYQALAGILPTRGDNVGRVFKIITTGAIAPLEEHASGLTASIYELVDRMLTVSPDERPDDLREVQAAFETHVGTRPSAVITARESADGTADTVATDGSSDEVAPDPTADTVVDGLSEEEPLAADEVARGGKADEAPPAPPPTTAARGSKLRWALWIVLTAWIPALFLLVPSFADILAELTDGVLGSGTTAAVIGARVLQAVLVVLACSAIWVLGRFWSRGTFNRWLLGDGLLAGGALAFILFVYRYARYSTQLDLLTAELRSYVKVQRGPEFANSLASTTASYITTAGAISFLFGMLSVLVLLAVLFVRRPPGPRPWLRAGLLTAAGAAATGIAVALWFRELIEAGSPPTLVAMLLVWLLTAAGLALGASGTPDYLESTRAGSELSQSAVVFKHGLLAIIYLFCLAVVMAIAQVFVFLAGLPAGSRVERLVEAAGLLRSWFWVQGGMLVVLVALGAVFFAREIGAGFGATWRVRLREAARFVVLVLAAVAYPASAQAVFADFAQLQRTSWTLAKMLPAKTLFLDAAPRSWDDLRVERFVLGLSGGGEASPFARLVERSVLQEQLAAQSGCLGEQAEGVASEAAVAAAARCVSPAQAQLYCAAIGARLPTPEEWGASLGAVSPQPKGDGDGEAPTEFVRTTEREWAMETRHGSPAFFAMGAEQSPVEVAAGQADEQVGFRCAFTF